MQCKKTAHWRGDVSEDDMHGAAVGWWPAACGMIKAGGKVCYLRLRCYILTLWEA